jgi:hypothetical protein
MIAAGSAPVRLSSRVQGAGARHRHREQRRRFNLRRRLGAWKIAPQSTVNIAVVCGWIRGSMMNDEQIEAILNRFPVRRHLPFD